MSNFTDKQKHLLFLIACGKTNPQICSEIGVNKRTLESRVAKLLELSGFLSNRCALTSFAINEGLITAPTNHQLERSL